jgi:HEAT repeat protein
VLAAACLAPRPDPSPAPIEATPYTPPAPVEPDPIGFFLTEYDATLRAWSNYKLGGRGSEDRRTVRTLERELSRRARERQPELVLMVESGPPNHRSVAAAALGFTGDPEVLSPLLAALSDPEPEVVNNALLGLGLLGDPDTPLARVLFLLRKSPDAWTRNNAAFALYMLVWAGARSDDVAAANRGSLTDPEPGVRVQTARVAGRLADVEAIAVLGDLLHDDVALVSAAAASSLASIASQHLEEKGRVARLLVDALDRVKPSHASRIRSELSLLRGSDLGDDIEPWKEWAYRMP